MKLTMWRVVVVLNTCKVHVVLGKRVVIIFPS